MAEMPEDAVSQNEEPSAVPNKETGLVMGLVITTQHTPHRWRFSLAGTLDTDTVSLARSAILSMLQGLPGDIRARPLVLDLRPVSYLDAAGLAFLKAVLFHQCQVSSTLSLIVAPGSQPETVLSLARFERLCSTPPCFTLPCSTITKLDVS